MESESASTSSADANYFVLGGSATPYLLARVCWPDVAQAITAGCRNWLEDPGLFDLPYDPISASVSLDRAAEIAAGWGSSLPTESTPTREFIRRMPAVWSSLTPAELRAFSLDFAGWRPEASTANSRDAVLVGRDGAKTHRRLSFMQLFRRSRPEVGDVMTTSDVSIPETLATAAVPASSGTAASGATVGLIAEDIDLPPTGMERRRHARVPVGGWAQIRYGRDTVSADIVDFSEGGVHWVVLDTNAAFQVGEKLDAPFVLEGDDSRGPFNLDVAGTVIWHSDTKLGTHFGVAFEALSDEQAQRVRHLLVTSGAERD
jgi:hypothetical protein